MKHETLTDKPLVQIYCNRIQNRVAFKIKFGYYVEVLRPEAMKLLGNTEQKLTKGKNFENVAQLETTEVVSVHVNIINNQ